MLTTMTGARMGVGRSCGDAFTGDWPRGKKRIQDRGMGVGHEAGNQTVGQKASRESNIQKDGPRQDVPRELLRDAQTPGL